jgi:hypothetical protein
VLARRLLEPTYLHTPEYVETFGPEVADICARAGYAPDPEQELILDATFAILPSGKPAAFEVDMVGPRQNFKTGVLKMIELGWLFVTKERLIIHSAHELTTAEETFRETAALIEDNRFLSRQLLPTRGDRPGITASNGRWAIELTGDRRLRYKARMATGGRGLAGDKVVLDEFFAVTPAMIGSLYPTLTARPKPQVVSASSAGLLSSDALRDKRDRGRAGLTANQFYIEYSDPEGPTPKIPTTGCETAKCTHAKTAEGCALDDEGRWKRIMPALGDRVMPETIRSMRQSMPPAEFAREFLVWWEDPPLDVNEQIFGAHWGKQGLSDAAQPKPLCLGVGVEPARRWSSIGAVGDYGDDGMRVVFPATSDPKQGGHRRGTTWVVDEVCDIAERHEIPVAIAAYGPGADMVEKLRERLGENRVLVADMGDLKDACADFFDGVTESHQIFHGDDPDLNAPARQAIKRMSGDRFLWGRQDTKRKDKDEEPYDVSMLEAVTLAYWGAGHATDYDVLDSIG